MKARVYIIALLSAVSVLVNAQSTWTSPANDPAVQSHQIIKVGAMYQGTVYEPFDNSTPSERDYQPARTPGIRRSGELGDGYSDGLDGFDDDAPEYGQGPSPIGDAMWPLMLLVGAYCGVMIFRRKRALRE